MSNFNASVYFGTPMWSNEVPEFIKPINKLSDKYIKKAKKDLLPSLKERDKLHKRKLGDFGLSNHSVSINMDPEAKEFSQYCGDRSHEFLDWCGFDIRNHSRTILKCGCRNFLVKVQGIIIPMCIGILMLQVFIF
tara:strand:- start:379 stop:783 length:405 start_codon:yes stop_codon:yes gene_type:complete